MSLVKSALKPLLRPLRLAGGRFLIRPADESNTIVWKAAQILSGELVEGDYLEFGVFRGDSFIRSYGTIRDVYRSRSLDEIHSVEYRNQVLQLWTNMRFFAFDSFSGLPSTDAFDRQTNDFVEGKFACDLPAFRKNIKSGGVDLSKVVTVPGWFEETCVAETIKKYEMRAAAIIHVDCDLYDSASVALKFIEPLLVDGTVLIFDDWYCFRGNPELGERRAFLEWSRDMPGWTFTEYQKEGPWRNSYVANRLLGIKPDHPSRFDLSNGTSAEECGYESR